MDTGLINERAPFTKAAQGRVWGSLPPLLRSQHELSRPMAKRPAYGRNSGIPAGSPPPTLLPAGIPGLFPRGLRRRALVTRTRSESAGACWVAKGRGDPTPAFCIRACSPRPRSRTHCSALPEGALSGPHAERSSRSLCAGARTRPPIRSSSVPPPPQTARTRSRARQVGPPHHGPAWNPASCPGRTSLAGSAEARRASMRPESRRRRPRSPPRRGDSSRFEFTTARPVPSPPAGSQRHVTTGAAEGQSRARAGCRGRRAGRAAGPAARDPSPAPSAPSRAGPGPGAAAAGPTPLPWRPQPGFSGMSPAPVSRPFVPTEDARPWATAWSACGPSARSGFAGLSAPS